MRVNKHDMECTVNSKWTLLETRKCNLDVHATTEYSMDGIIEEKEPGEVGTTSRRNTNHVHRELVTGRFDKLNPLGPHGGILNTFANSSTGHTESYDEECILPKVRKRGIESTKGGGISVNLANDNNSENCAK